MSDQLPDPATSDMAARILEEMLLEVQQKGLCPHCVGMDLIYLIAREMTAHTDTQPGELFSMVHVGIGDGEDMQDEGEHEGGEEDGGGHDWTVH